MQKKKLEENLHPPRCSPGPAAYNQVPIEKVKSSNPKYSIKGKKENDYSTEVPGPGNYDPLVKTNSGPKFTFGSSNQDNEMKEKLKYVS